MTALRITTLSSFAILLLGAIAFGCSSHDDDHTHSTVRPAVCNEISSACHAFESIPEGKACHEEAHEAWDEAKCNAEKARCLAICVATDAGTDSAADSSAEAAADGG